MLSDMWTEALAQFFDSFPQNAQLPPSNEIAAGVLKYASEIAMLHNAACGKEERWPIPKTLSTYAASEILSKTHVIKNIDLMADPKALNPHQASKSPGVLGMYKPDQGIYLIDGAGTELTDCLYKEIVFMDNTIKVSEYDNILKLLRCKAPVAARTANPDLIPVANGVFDYKTKTLLPFSPDFIFLTKCPVPYVPNAANPVIHNPDDNTDWDIESWLADLSDDPAIVSLFWQIIGAIIRPFVRWDQAVILYATKGNNGKGTFCALLRALCANAVALQVSDFSQTFALEQLICADAVISDENDVGTYIEHAGNFKRAVTADVLSINRKYKPQISYRFQGLIVQCYNDFPRIRDKTESFARRLLYIPFEKCFTGAERGYIREKYVCDKKVLEYVLCKALHSNFYEFDIPAASVKTLHEYQIGNNPVADFAEDILPVLKWDLVPFTFLYDLYKEWFRKTNPSGTIVNSRTFIRDLLSILDTSGLPFSCVDHTKCQKVTKTNMTDAEPLILEYNLENWMNPVYKGSNPDLICRPVLKQVYRGITRKI